MGTLYEIDEQYEGRWHRRHGFDGVSEPVALDIFWNYQSQHEGGIHRLTADGQTLRQTVHGANCRCVKPAAERAAGEYFGRLL